ncbi:MAG: sulfotransferase [Actinomycetales bacterium]|nr:sulfotransferase [Actinomycetales bacterium]
MNAECHDPVLIGGTGRSGSTILGRVLGRHPALFLTNPEEVRFIANPGGAAATLATAQAWWPKRWLAGRESARTVRKCKTIWFDRPGPSGLQLTITMDELDELGARYMKAIRVDPLRATTDFTHAIMAKVAASAPGRRWVDGTPANARVTDLIEPIYPRCQVVSIVRDGRDVAASFVEQKFGPKEVFEALDTWAERSRRMKTAVDRCQPGRILTIDLLDLVRCRRRQTLEQVCGFLGISADPKMLQWFDENVSEERAHIGRWRSQFDESTRLRIDQHYARLVASLERDGVQIPLES